MKCKYCGIYLEDVDEESINGMAHTIKCQTKRIHELENENENEKNSDGDKLVKYGSIKKIPAGIGRKNDIMEMQ